MFCKSSIFVIILSLISVDIAYGMDDSKLAFQLTTLFRASRSVVTKNKALIGDPKQSLGVMTPEAYVAKFVKKTKKNYKKNSGAKFPKVDGSPEGNARSQLLDSIKEIITKAVKGDYEGQFVYSENAYFRDGVKKYDNKFLPARYAVEVMKNFSEKTGGKITLKLTAPDDLLVKKSNAADEWEQKVIKTIFSKSGYERGTPYSEVTNTNGKKTFRQLLPEYYKKGCIGCHGDGPGQNGASIHQSGIGSQKKVLGGAISIIIEK